MIQKLADYIIRPKSFLQLLLFSVYLGGDVFLIDNKFYCERLDFEVKNRRNLKLKCSLFHRSIDEDRQYPLVVYCHGNSGNRTESYDAVCHLLRLNILVICFDFAGCGLSEGSHISLGYYEKDDIEDVLEFVKKSYDFIDHKRMGIWGRSMGAVSTLLFTATHPEICFLVLDSPFANLSVLLKEYIDKFKVNKKRNIFAMMLKIVSKIAGKYIYKNLRHKVIEQAGFDVEEIDTFKAMSQCVVPILFVHGTNDTLVPIHHSQKLYENYGGEKIFLEIDEGHNDVRSEKVMEDICKFIINCFLSWKPPVSKTNLMETSPSLNHQNTLCEVTDQKEAEKPLDSKYSQSFMKLSDMRTISGDLNGEEEPTEDFFENQRRPFSRQNKRHMMFYQANSTLDREDEIQERNPEGRSHRILKSRTSVDLTNLLAAKRTQKATVLFKMNTATFVVSKSDAEQVEKIVTIFKEMKDEEFAIETNRPESSTFGKPRSRPTINLDHQKNKSLSLDDGNIDADDISDSPALAKKDVLEPYISSAAGSNFELFRQKKSLHINHN